MAIEEAGGELITACSAAYHRLTTFKTRFGFWKMRQLALFKDEKRDRHVFVTPENQSGRDACDVAKTCDLGVESRCRRAIIKSGRVEMIAEFASDPFRHRSVEFRRGNLLDVCVVAFPSRRGQIQRARRAQKPNCDERNHHGRSSRCDRPTEDADDTLRRPNT